MLAKGSSEILSCPTSGFLFFFYLRFKFGGWRDGLEVKRTDCSSRGPEFNSQQPHGGSKPSVIGYNDFSSMSEDSYSVLRYNNNLFKKYK